MRRSFVLVIFTLGIIAAAWGANPELKLATPIEAKLTEDACLHVDPSDDSELVMCLMSGAELTLVARQKDKTVSEGKEGFWYKAEFGDDQVGWVFSTKVDTSCGGSSGPCGGCPSGKK